MTRPDVQREATIAQIKALLDEQPTEALLGLLDDIAEATCANPLTTTEPALDGFTGTFWCWDIQQDGRTVCQVEGEPGDWRGLMLTMGDSSPIYAGTVTEILDEVRRRI